MQFLWYGALPLLLLIPALVLGYWWIQHRRTRYALRYPSLLVANQAIEKKPDFRRHVPPIVFLIAVSSMLLALTRPYTVAPISSLSRTVILTIDVSASMMRADIKPNRMEAAKSAARDFIMQQDPALEIGVVAFSETASLVQVPTTDHPAVVKAVDRLQIDSSTAIGSGILTSLDAIARGTRSGNISSLIQFPADNSTRSTDMVLPGAIVLLTDGQNVVGPSPIDAAVQAARYGVRVYTVGIGTSKPRPPLTVRPPDELDEGTLTQIAEITDAKYLRAFDEAALSEIYKNLHLQINIKQEKAELAPGLTGLAIILVLAGATLSFRWNGGIP